MKAFLRKIRITPKKANLVAGMVRRKKVTEALSILKFTPKKAAKILYKVIHSAASNAKNNFKQSMDDLVITRILVTKGPTYKRSLPVSRGRSHPILKRTSHITVEVGVPEDAKKPKAAPQQEKITEEKAVLSKKEVKATSGEKTASRKSETTDKPSEKTSKTAKVKSAK